MSQHAAEGSRVTLNGDLPRGIDREDGETVMVGDATVVRYDLSASNGVVHVIDTVLIPPAT